jgi:hypothetical protein
MPQTFVCFGSRAPESVCYMAGWQFMLDTIFQSPKLEVGTGSSASCSRPSSPDRGWDPQTWVRLPRRPPRGTHSPSRNTAFALSNTVKIFLVATILISFRSASFSTTAKSASLARIVRKNLISHHAAFCLLRHEGQTPVSWVACHQNPLSTTANSKQSQPITCHPRV